LQIPYDRIVVACPLNVKVNSIGAHALPRRPAQSAFPRAGLHHALQKLPAPSPVIVMQLSPDAHASLPGSHVAPAPHAPPPSKHEASLSEIG
jgi:hypothetical protein